MALLKELDSAPGADKFPEMYAKINEAIQTINAVLGAGLAGQGIKKVDGTDFNFEFFDAEYVPKSELSDALTDGTYTIKTKLLPIPSWNMDSDATKSIAHGLDFNDIVSISVLIHNDAGTLGTDLIVQEGGGDTDGYYSKDSTNIIMGRRSGASYDNSNYSSSLVVRGWIKITHI